jgi:glycosyltransferase involved in cell wall biosynthesis
MKLSVVIPAKNAAAHLNYVLPALLPQLLPDDECFVIDDASSDATGEIAQGYGVSVVLLKMPSGPSVARNLGATRATGDILVFLDSDVVPHPGLLDKMREQLHQAPDLSALIGSYDANPAAQSTVSRFRNLLHCYTHQHGNQDASTFWTGCGAVRRADFEQIGGFDAIRFPTPGMEDIDLGLRLRRQGSTIHLNPELLVQHRKCWTLRGMLRADLIERAIPWTTLILESGSMPLDLNLTLSQRVSGAATAGAWLLLLLVPWVWPLAAAACVAALLLVIALNARFYGFLARHGGWWFALRSIPLHLLYFSCGVLGYGIAFWRFYLWKFVR